MGVYHPTREFHSYGYVATDTYMIDSTCTSNVETINTSLFRSSQEIEYKLILKRTFKKKFKF